MAINTASSRRFMTVMILMASDIPLRFTAVKTTVVRRARRAMFASGRKYARMVRAKTRAYMPQARVFPIQKNQPVPKARGFERVLLVKEYPPPARGMAAPSSL